jgi:hypothetical protein
LFDEKFCSTETGFTVISLGVNGEPGRLIKNKRFENCCSMMISGIP